jgi:DNA recombination protein RmuC
MDILFLFTGLALGFIIAWFAATQKTRGAQQQAQSQAQADLAAAQAKVQAAESAADVARQGTRRLEEQVERLSAELRDEGARRSKAEEQATRIPKLETAQTELAQRLEVAQRENGALQADLKGLQVTLEKERKQAEEKLAVLNEAREQLTVQFKQLAQEIFDAKSKAFVEQNKVNLDGILKPLSEKIKDFEKKVEESYVKESKERVLLGQEIKNLQAQTLKIGQDAVNLANALKGQTKTQGNWGEFILERVLEKSGLVKGREYDVQVSLANEEGKRFQPDVIVHLPDNRHVVVDSKVSLVAYERFCSLEDESERKLELEKHVASLRKHVADLSGKRYQDLYQLKSLDLVLLFIPVEPAFMAAVQYDQELFNDAFDKNIVLVSPSTLLGMLRTIESVWRQEYQMRNVQDIAREAGNLYDKFVGFVTDLEEIGKKIQATQTSYDAAFNKLKTGRGNLITRAESVRKLGAKTSKALPSPLVETATEDPTEPQGELVTAGAGLLKLES